MRQARGGQLTLIRGLPWNDRSDELANRRDRHFQVISMPKKCRNTCRAGRFLGFCCGLRM